jgi:hypothetical protein
VASSRDQRGGKSRTQRRDGAKGDKKPSERIKREVRRLDRERGISAEMAAQMQAQWGNQAVAQLLELPGERQLAATSSERRDLAQEEEELLERAGEEQDGPQHESSRGAGLAATLGAGLPDHAASVGAGLGRDQQYGGDGEQDDEPLPLPDEPEPGALIFDRSGRGNLARLQEQRAAGRLPPATLAEARSELARGSSELARRGRDEPQPMGDALFRCPLEAWEDASLVAGRGCGVDERQDLAGPYDALGRPMAVGAFAQERATTPLGRSLARLCATAPGTLMPTPGGLAGAAARLGALAALGMAADGLGRGSMRDRALRTALAQAAVELTLLAAGEVARSVPPAHSLYARITGQRPTGAPPPGEASAAARHWLIPALRAAGQLAPLPRVRRWRPPPLPPILDPDDPLSVVDAALRGGRADGESERLVDTTPLLGSIEAMLAAGGRAQVELCAAALACRRPAFDGAIASSLRRAYRSFRAVALELLQAKEVLGAAHQQPLENLEGPILRANHELERLRERMEITRQRCLLELAAITELG